MHKIMPQPRQLRMKYMIIDYPTEVDRSFELAFNLEMIFQLKKGHIWFFN
jgi:hypothetical protein